MLHRKKVKFIIYLKFQFDNLCKNVHDFSLEDKTNIEDDEAIDLSEILKEEEQPTLDLNIEPNIMIDVVQQNQVEEAEIIEMVILIHIEDMKVVLEEDLIEKVKFIREHIEHQLRKDKSYLIVICCWKSSLPQKNYERRKLMKYGFFRVSRKIDEKDNKFEL